MLGLIYLPYEVLSNIISHIDLEDLFDLGQTCRKLRDLMLWEESLCKKFVQSKISYSNEALSSMVSGATDANARAVRRCAKRRHAMSTVKPFAAATIGFCDAYLYCKGVLCYMLDDRIRILDLHNSGKTEIVISIPSLLKDALCDLSDHYKGTFQILYYADDIISCLYKSHGFDSAAWLIAFSLKQRQILVVEELDSTDKIFVRHDKQFLFYGTHSELGTDGHKKWVIHGYDFLSRKWFGEKVHLPDLVGSEIGSTICFEFYNDYFYALSNQTSFEAEEIDWTSYYHCSRFPLGSPCNGLLEKTNTGKDMWRRQHQEGPIDDRWTNLRLAVDEQSGMLKIMESRKEWYMGSSRSQRTYYTSDVVFPELCKEAELEIASNSSDSTFDTFFDGSDFTSTSALSNVSLASATTNFSTTTSIRDLSAYPDEPIASILDKHDNPNYERAPPPRRPQHTHPGNDGSNQPTFTLAKSRVRSYHSSCSTYMDLVDDPLPTDWQGKQRLRIRSGSRRLRPPLVYPEGDKKGLERPPSDDLNTALNEMYKDSEVNFWPPAQEPDTPDEYCDQIYRLLNPPTHLGNVEGTSDESGMIYVTGGSGAPQAIIFISFDPATKLVGLKRWGGLLIKGVGEGPHVDGRATGPRDIDVEERDRTVGIERKGKGKEGGTDIMQMGQTTVEFCGDLSANPGEDKVGSTPVFAWKEKAMYRDIGLGFYFGL